jgi:predicted metal-dependent hydrolase
VPRRVLRFVRNPRARRYIIRVRPDAIVRVTIPRGGSQRGAAEFVARHTHWIDAQLTRLTRAAGHASAPLAAGDLVPVRGVPTAVTVEPAARGRMKVRLGDAPACLAPAASDVRLAVTAALRALAQRELPGRLLVLASQHGLAVSRVTIRNQRTRWGSCATTGAISLNWRLVQMPPEVRDYVLVHELMHLREPNHSRRFWRHVARACPWHLKAREWLRREGKALL